MSIQIKLKNSVVQDSTPSASDLPEVGELAVNGNINSIGGFMRASDNTIVKIFGPGSVTTPTATTTVSGISELATNTETTTGTATNRVVTPAGLNAVTVAERTTSNTNYVAKAGSTLTGVLTMPNGSNSAPAINFGDSDSGIFGGTNTVSLAAGGTTRLTADTGVSVVGTLAVTGAITSTSDLTIPDKIIHSGDTNTAIRFPAADTVSVETGGSERARIDSSGRLLIGTSTSRSVAAGQALLQIENTTTELFSIINTANDNGGSVLAIGKTRNGTIVQNDDTLGRLAFYGDDGNDVDRAAADIMAAVDGTPGTNDMPGRLIFRTTADGGSNPTERLRIDSTGLVKLPDNGKFVAGAGNDLQIYHDGTHSFVEDTGTGQLRLCGDNAVVFRKSAYGDVYALGNADGSFELYYDNSKKLETDTNGITVTGRVVASGTSNIGFAGLDNVKLSLGTSDDLQIYHDGSNSVVHNDNGSVIIENDASNANSIFIKAKSGEHSITANHNGAVELYHDGSLKLETTANGVQVTGRIDILGTGTRIDIADNGKIILGDGNDLQIYHDGSNSYIDEGSGTGALIFKSNTYSFRNAADNEQIASFNENGAVELYFDNSKKFETTSTGVAITGGLTTSTASTINADFTFAGASSKTITFDQSEGHIRYLDNAKAQFGTQGDLQIYHDGGNSIIRESGTGSLFIESNTNIFLGKESGAETYIKGVPDGAVELYFDNSKKFETTSTGSKTTGTHLISGESNIDSQGNPLLFLQSTANTSIKAVFLLEDDYTTGRAALAINVGEAGVTNDRDLMLQKAGGRVGIRCTPTESFEVSGTSKFNGDIKLGDSNKLKLGAGDDLLIYHDGTSNIITSVNGNLVIQAASGEEGIKVLQNGSVELYYDNSKKFETTSDGITVTGKIMPSANNTHNIGSASLRFVNLFMSNAIDMGDGATIQFGDGDDFKIFHDGTNSVINNDTGGLYIKNDGVIEFQKASSGETKAKFISDGAVELYHDNSKKFHTTSTGAYITGGIIINGGANWFIVDAGTGSADSYRATTAGGIMHFFSNVGGTRTMKSYINENGVLTSASDYRLKTDIAEVTNGISIVKDLKPSTYKWKHDSTTTHHGFIAHELQTVLPNCIDGDKDGVKSDGTTPHYQFYSDQELVPVLTAALKEAITKIETLETKVAALEAA